MSSSGGKATGTQGVTLGRKGAQARARLRSRAPSSPAKLSAPVSTRPVTSKRSACFEANASVWLHTALGKACLYGDAMGRDVVLVAVSGNARHARLFESPFDEGSCCLGGVSTVPKVGMDSIADFDLPVGVRVPLKAGGSDNSSGIPLD